MTRYLAALALVLVACGDKPKPAPTPPPAAPQPGGSLGSAPPATRTVGGVDLTGASEPVRTAALALATSRRKGAEGLAAAGPDAGPIVERLLGSAGLNEILGALDVLGLPDDPTRARARAMPAVLALLGHDAPDVRSAASKIATGSDDAKVFIAMLEAPQPAVRVEAVRLLARWSGPSVEAGLLPLLAAPQADDELALEAALALGARGKTASPAVTEAAAAACAAPAPGRRLAGFVLSRRLGLAVPAEAVEAALAADDAPALQAEGVRAAAPEKLVALAADPRPRVRRVVAEELARVTDVGARDALADQLAQDADPEVRAAVAASLPRIGAGTGSAMDRLLVDDVAYVRRAALAATAGLPDAAAATRLRMRLAGAGEDDKQFIVWALEHVPHRSAVELLIDQLGDRDVGPIAHIVLQNRTGQTFGADPGPWRAWLDQTDPPPPPTPDGPAPKPDAPKPDAPKPDAPKPDAPK